MALIPGEEIPVETELEVPEVAPAFTLTPEHLESAGLIEPQVGDRFTVTVTGVVTDNTNGVKADIESAMDGVKIVAETEEDAEPVEEPPIKKPQSRVVGPKEAGFTGEF